MKNSFTYNITSDNNYDLIIEPGPYHYEFKSQELVNVTITQISDEPKLNQDNIFLSFENETITLILNSMDVSCKFIITKNGEVIDEFTIF